MEYKQFVFNPIQENTYVVYDETREAVIIDAGNFNERENAALTDFISGKNLIVKAVLCTHCHWDHIFGLDWVAQQYKPEIYCHAEDLPWIENFSHICMSYGFGERKAPYPTNFIADSQTIKFGNTVLTVLHTPGHSAGGVCFYCEADNVLFSGDTLFFSSIGRADLPGGSEPQLISSIRDKLLALPDSTAVLPGHGLQTSIGFERINNPYLQ
ncbi:MAG: MBL fold metallo-hydrolase [Salinivirgaceae bacterium]|nr:MBL fold metallo-hydrolase [Salinivirgaceae bacterium]